MRKLEAVRCLWTVRAFLIAERQVKISDFPKDISFKIEDEVIRKLISFRLVLDQRRLRIIARVNHLVNTEFADQFLVPTDEVDIAI